MNKPIVLVIGLCMSGCTVGVSADSSTKSTGIPCASKSDCGAEMNCQDGFCQGNPAIPTVLMDIAFPASENLADYSASSFVLMLDVPPEGRGDITLPALESLKIDANFDQLASRDLGCTYDRAGDSSRKVRAALSHQWPVDGLELNPPRVANDLPANFSALPVETEYEVYLSLSDDFQSSLIAQNPSCGLPPVLFRDVPVGSYSSLTLSWPSPKAIAVDIQVTPFSTDCISDLQGWQVDVVDPVEGRELAIPVALGAAVVDDDDPKKTHYHATVSYNPIATAVLSPPAGTELLRLQPPANGIAPIYYAAISTLSLFDSTGELVLPLDGVPSPVVLTGRVETADSSDPIEQAEVTFTNFEFSVPNPGLAAKFSSSTTTDSSGQFEITLPSGGYKVLAIPPSGDQHASMEVNWTIKSSPSTQGGRLLSIPFSSQLRGSVDGSVQWGSSASGMIQATPSSSILVDAATGVATVRQTTPGARAARASFIPAQSNSFNLFTDSGTYDVSLHPPDGLPWIVSAAFDMNQAIGTMNPWSMPLPVSWSGHLRVPAANAASGSNLDELPRAMLRVYVLLNGDKKRALGAVEDGAWLSQIAETRAAADGSFSLVLPDRLQPQ